MLTEQEIKEMIKRVRALPAEKQADIIDYISYLEWKTEEEKYNSFRIVKGGKE